jgi:hypothetical protein
VLINTTFNSVAIFTDATFGAKAAFSATFSTKAYFTNATFGAKANFSDATFGAMAGRLLHPEYEEMNKE